MEEKAEKTKTKVSPNIFLRVAGTFSLVYYGLSGILFFLALIFVRFLTEMTEIYLQDFNLSASITFIFVLAGFLLHLLVVIGLLMLMIKGKKTGYFLFILASIPILLIQMISLNSNGYEKFILEIGMIFLISLIYILTPKGTYVTDIMSVDQINGLNEE